MKIKLNASCRLDTFEEYPKYVAEKLTAQFFRTIEDKVKEMIDAGYITESESAFPGMKQFSMIVQILDQGDPDRHRFIPACAGNSVKTEKR